MAINKLLVLMFLLFGCTGEQGSVVFGVYKELEAMNDLYSIARSRNVRSDAVIFFKVVDEELTTIEDFGTTIYDQIYRCEYSKCLLGFWGDANLLEKVFISACNDNFHFSNKLSKTELIFYILNSENKLVMQAAEKCKVNIYFREKGENNEKGR